MRIWTFLKTLVFLYLYFNLQKDWLKTREDIASQRLDTIYDILEIYIRYIYYVYGRSIHGHCPVPLPALDMSDSEDDSKDEQQIDPNLNEDNENESDVIAEKFEDYSPPNYRPHQDEEVTIDDQFAWILLWIMNFRIRFNISGTATESLIKFMKLVLTEIAGDKYKNFPSSKKIV